ncbi:MAG: hypothetical protein K2K80_04835 [Clostridia bacterium]|nr:hypothetical protein [Clostridia bacterium]
MKKLLSATLAIAMGATIVGVVTGCDNNPNTPSDAETAEKAVGIIRTLYIDKDKETNTSYTVVGKVKVDGSIYDVDWTVTPDATCTVENFSNYVSVGSELNTETDEYTVSISRATQVIEYKLNASVTVGTATESVSFDREVPAKASEESINEVLSFNDLTCRKVFNANQQVWEKGDLKLTNDKASSSTPITNNDSSEHARLYAGSKTKIEYPGITKIVFTTSHSDYTANLKTILENDLPGSTIEVEEGNTPKKLTLTLATPVDVIELNMSKQVRLTSIDVEGTEGGAPAESKVAAAKAALDLANKNYYAAGTYDLPAEQSGVAVTWAVKGTSENVTIENGKLKISSVPATETSVTLTATLKSGEVTDDKDIAIKLIKIEGVTHAGTEADPYTASEAKIVALKLADGETSKVLTYVKGYVVANSTFDSANAYKGFQNLYISDTDTVTDTSSEDAFYVYGLQPDGTVLTADSVIYKGDLITCKGYLQNYVPKADTHVPELTGATCVEIKEYVDERTDAEKAQAALDELTVPATVTGDLTLTTLVKGVTLSITASDKLESIALDGKVTRGDVDVSVVITVTATCGDAHVDQEFTVTVQANVQLDHAGTEADPFTLADVKKLADTLQNGSFVNGAAVHYPYSDANGAKLVYVKGYVVDAGSYSDKYGNYSNIYLIDVYSADATKNSDGVIQLYRLYLDTQYVTKDGDLEKGDLITVKGYIEKYSGNAQISYTGNGEDKNPSVVAKENASNAVKVANALAAVAKLDDISATGEKALPTSSVEGVNFTWVLAEGTTVVTYADGKLNVAELPAEDTEVTITLTATLGDDHADKTLTFKVKAASTSVSTWTKVTSANASDLKDGAVIILSATASGKNVAMGASHSNGTYRTIVENFDATAAIPESVVTVTLKAVEGKENVFYLLTNEGADSGYLTANTANNVLTKTEVQEGGLSEWKIAVDADGNATITNQGTESRILRYNSGSPRFAAYKSGQTAPVIYIEK